MYVDVSLHQVSTQLAPDGYQSANRKPRGCEFEQDKKSPVMLSSPGG